MPSSSQFPSPVKVRKACRALLSGFRKDLFPHSGYSPAQNRLMLSLMIETEYESVCLLDMARRVSAVLVKRRRFSWLVTGVLLFVLFLMGIGLLPDMPSSHPFIFTGLCIPPAYLIFHILYFRPINALLHTLCGRTVVRNMIRNTEYGYAYYGSVHFPEKLRYTMKLLGEDGCMRVLAIMDPHDMFALSSLCNGTYPAEMSVAQMNSLLKKSEAVFLAAGKQSGLKITRTL